MGLAASAFPSIDDGDGSQDGGGESGAAEMGKRAAAAALPTRSLISVARGRTPRRHGRIRRGNRRRGPGPRDPGKGHSLGEPNTCPATVRVQTVTRRTRGTSAASPALSPRPGLDPASPAIVVLCGWLQHQTKGVRALARSSGLCRRSRRQGPSVRRSRRWSARRRRSGLLRRTPILSPPSGGRRRRRMGWAPWRGARDAVTTRIRRSRR